MNAYDLRPLDIGEILDRAVTLFVRRFAAFILVLSIVAVPLAIVSFALQPQTASIFEDLRRVLAAPPGHRQATAAAIAAILARNRAGPGLGILIVVGLLGQALSLTACRIAINDAYAGRMPSVRDAYRRALGRWLPEIVVIVVYLAATLIAIIGLFIALAVILVAAGLLAKAVAWIGIVLGVVLAVAFVVALVLVSGLLYFAYGLSSVAVAIEAPNPIRALEIGIRRTLAPGVIRRSLLVALTLFALFVLGQIVLSALGGTLAVVTRQTAFAPIVTVIGSLLLSALTETFLVVYSIDMRVRREGYDLLLDAAGERAAS